MVNTREEKDKCLDLAIEMSKLWEFKVMVILIEVSDIGTVPTGLKKWGSEEESKLSGHLFSRNFRGKECG